MSTQISPQTIRLEVWIRFLRAHSAITRELSAELVSTHGLTLSDYEVLLHLSRAPDGLLRRIDLAERVLLTPSGITRLLEGLERAGLVCRASCPTDARVSYAKLTDAGLERLRAASSTHLEGVSRLFVGQFSAAELTTLGTLLARLPGGEPEPDESECAA